MPTFATADLCDAHEFADYLHIAEPIFRICGGKTAFFGEIVTVRVFEDNVLVKQQLASPGNGRVLVVDGGASLRVALMGDNLAQMGADNGWSGVIINGCIRDAAEIASIDIGIRALNTTPRRSIKRGEGETNVPVTFAGVRFVPGHFVYADADGILVADRQL